MSFRLVTLYSGSSGNCVLIDAAGTKILIDAGKSAKALCSALRTVGSDISEIKAIFITHEHCDHISALNTLCKKQEIPVHMTEGSAKKLDREPDSSVHLRLLRHDTEFTQVVEGLTVTSFRTPHDSKMSVGYRISFEDESGTHNIGVATDIGYVSDKVLNGLLGCEAVVLESNHDPEMLQNGPYPHSLKVRIQSRGGHLSNRDCADLAAHLSQNGTRSFILAHLSAENNLPELAFDEANSAISDPNVKICIAAADCPTELVIG